MNNKFRDRKFNLVLYPDEDSTHALAFAYIQDNFDYIACKHDSDLDENNQLKKSHYHIVLKFSNAVWNTALAKELGINENYIQKCSSFNKSMLYLIHYNNPDKYQYDTDSVIGSRVLLDRFYRLIATNEKTPEELSNEIIDFIDSYVGILNTIDFMRWINANGLFSNLKSGSGWYRDIIKEHNTKIVNSSYYYKKKD